MSTATASSTFRSTLLFNKRNDAVHPQDIASRVRTVFDRVNRAAERAGRDPRSVTVVAVGKTKPASMLAEAVLAGITDLGENRVQEAEAKKPNVPPARWHMIGHLQRNKAGKALRIFDVIQTLDNLKLVERLEMLIERDFPGRVLPVLIEVNLAEEPTKSGCLVEELPALARRISESRFLDLQGLMAIPPYDPDPKASRPYFARLRQLRDELQQFLGVGLPHLSMGMSHDFEVAVEEGATMVRVGTAIFGPRS